MAWLLLALLIVSNWLWFVVFYLYRKEVKRQWHRWGVEKWADIYMAGLEARLDEVQRVGHMEHKKDTPAIYYHNNDGSTVILLEDREDELKRQIAKGPASMHLDHVKPISKTVNVTNADPAK
jgi:hypothetical protein